MKTNELLPTARNGIQYRQQEFESKNVGQPILTEKYY